MPSSHQEILAQLKNVKKISAGHTARCPAHDDGSNSLSISIGAGGKVLMHCHAGCTFEEIMTSLGNMGGQGQQEYQYHDESGQLIYEVVRRVPKGFAQRRPIGGGNWAWNLQGVRRVLYRLPELLRCEEGQLVFVCEGEKDVDRLAAKGLVATTNSGGAGKWQQGYSKYFKNLRVCILPDRDEPGMAHARTVAASLKGKAQSVRILELPGLQEKGDVSDWLNFGGTTVKLVELAEDLMASEESVAAAREEPQAEEQVHTAALVVDRTPHSPEIERAILGGVVKQPALIDQCRRLMPVEWFHLQYHQKIYAALLFLDEKRVEINEVMLAEVLKRQGNLEAVGGVAYIRSLSDNLPPVSDLSHYIETARKYAKARWGLKFAAAMAAKLQDGADPDEVTERAVLELDKTRRQSQNLRRPRSLGELYDDYALRLHLFYKGVSNAIPTGFPEVDEKLLGGGLIPSLTYVIAGRPSMGKSTFALDIAANAADAGFRVLYVSREMSAMSLMDRLAAGKSDVERFRISSGISKFNYEAVLEAVEAMRLVPIILDDTSESIQEVDHFLDEMERQDQRVDLIVMDYLQLMVGNSRDGRTNEVSQISRDSKGMAMRHEVPVVEVSQLTRAPGKEHREPELHDLRESGQIEQDADCVLFIHGDEPEEGMEFYQRKLLCRKQRDGPHFNRLLDMNARLVTFRTPDMLGHGKSERQRPGRITTTKDVRFRDKKKIAQENRILEIEAKDRAQDQHDF
jgi:replicative DNA helicase